MQLNCLHLCDNYVAEHSAKPQPSINLHDPVTAFMINYCSGTDVLPWRDEGSGNPHAKIKATTHDSNPGGRIQNHKWKTPLPLHAACLPCNPVLGAATARVAQVRTLPNFENLTWDPAKIVKRSLLLINYNLDATIFPTPAAPLQPSVLRTVWSLKILSLKRRTDCDQAGVLKKLFLSFRPQYYH